MESIAFAQVWLRFQLHQHSNLPIRFWTLGRTWTGIHSAVQHLGPLAEQYNVPGLVGWYRLIDGEFAWICMDLLLMTHGDDMEDHEWQILSKKHDYSEMHMKFELWSWSDMFQWFLNLYNHYNPTVFFEIHAAVVGLCLRYHSRRCHGTSKYSMVYY